jgi:hypothetical protein
MGKSIRSKAKRSFRSKKRETGVYAATEAARLHRLNSKLTSVASTEKDAGSHSEDVEEEADVMPGWCWFAALGLLDPSHITSDSMSIFMTGSRRTAERDLWHEEFSSSFYPFTEKGD